MASGDAANGGNEHIVSIKFIQDIKEGVTNAGKNILSAPQRLLNREFGIGTKEMKRFRYEFLSTMFAGMQMQKIFGGFIDNTLSMFGFTQLLGAFMTSILLPVFAMIAPLVYSIFKWLFSWSKETKFVAGFLVIVFHILAAILTAASMVALFLAGIAQFLFAGTGTPILLATLILIVGVAAVFFGIMVQIAMSVYAIYTHWQGIVDLMKKAQGYIEAPGRAILGAVGYNVPKMANGGVVSRPTLAMIGENGPEAVVPLGRGGSGIMSPTININANMTSNLDIHLLARRIFDELQALQASAYGAR